MLQFGRYECLGQIATGGMGTVYLGRVSGEGGFERLVALKVMHPHLARDDTFRDMFLDEARLAAAIHHPNVVGTIDVQRDQDDLFMVMDYVEGPSLHALRRDYSSRNDVLPRGTLVRILVDVLNGLHAAHEHVDENGRPLDIVHRDVTPQNILVGTDGVCRITDFGVARAASRLVTTQTGQIKGKIPYMAPEQLAAGTIDRRTDIYGVGVTLWEALTGKRLFAADNPASIISSIVASNVPRPSEVRLNVPPAIEKVCMRALSGTVDDRFADAQDMAHALLSAAESDGFDVASAQVLGVFVRSHSDLWTSPSEFRASRSFDRFVPPADVDVASASGTQAGTTRNASGVSAAARRRRQWLPMVGGGLIVLGIVAGVLGNSDAALVGKSDIELLRAEERLSYAVEQALVVSEDVAEEEEAKPAESDAVEIAASASAKPEVGSPPVKKKKSYRRPYRRPPRRAAPKKPFRPSRL